MESSYYFDVFDFPLVFGSSEVIGCQDLIESSVLLDSLVFDKSMFGSHEVLGLLDIWV